MIALYTRWFHDRALLIGWIAGIGAGTWMAAVTPQFKPIYPLALRRLTIAVLHRAATLILNFVVAIVLTPIFSAMGAQRGQDETQVEHYG